MATSHGAIPATSRRIAGVVASDSVGVYSIAAGAGFTISKQATGIVRITFTTAFVAAPVVISCPYYDTTVLRNQPSTQVSNRTTTSVDIRVLDASGTLADGGFDFIAEEAS